MKSAYAHELRALADVYERGATVEDRAVSTFIGAISDRAALFVGSGGSYPVAQLAADLHERFTGRVGRAVTPLEFSWLPPAADVAVLMFSASGRHPDATTAAITAREGGYFPAGLVTRRAAAELPAVLRRKGLRILTVQPDGRHEGFLATSSVLAMATAVARAYAVATAPLARTLTYFERPVPSDVRDRCLVLYAPGQTAAAVDLETRFHEAGLAAVQLSDYRNFAHGRHFGLARHLTDTTVISLVAEPFVELAEATLAALPSETHVLRLSSPLGWPSSILDLIVGSTGVAAAVSRRQKLNLTRPGVAAFGRRLYHMSPSRVRAEPPPGPVERKLTGLGTVKRDPVVRDRYVRAFREWMRALASVDFSGVVLDYDGTCCVTENRFEPVSKDVQHGIISLLRRGGLIGFASGSGRSLHSELRSWVPRRFWKSVYLGLYNGGTCHWLNSDTPEGTPNPELLEARRRIAEAWPSGPIEVRERAAQISLRSSLPETVPARALAANIAELLFRPPALDVRIVTSAHSVDVVPRGSSKGSVLAFLQRHTGSELLAIGDQGHWGGNDFELLSATPYSLSVDRCSSDTAGCWNLGIGAETGPMLLVKYLDALQREVGSLRFRWTNR